MYCCCICSTVKVLTSRHRHKDTHTTLYFLIILIKCLPSHFTAVVLSEKTTVANPFHLVVKTGYILIINNQIFPQRADLECSGSEEDVKNLKSLFDNFGLGPIKVVHNLSLTQLLGLLEETSKKDFSMFDCFICVILSHGSKEGIHGTDNEAIQVKALTSKFCHGSCPTLDGKPKVFFIQACHGAQEDLAQRESDSEPVPISNPQLPLSPDLLICFASSPGYQSYRQPEYGSLFISTIVKVFKSYATKEHLMNMMLRVNHEVASYYSNKGHKHIPSEICTLTKKVFFNALGQ